MKYIVILGDGMADQAVPELNGRTPLECAKKPNIDKLCQQGELGMVKTVPDGFAPGSDVANLSAMGYAPEKYYTGRSPLEAVSIGIKLKDSDVTFRCNTVTLSDEENYEDKTMVDYSADEITTEESTQLINYINENLHTDKITFYPGISYRHCMVFDGTHTDYDLTPPHDISDKCIKEYMPKGEDAELITEFMKKSYELLKNHPVNLKRIERGLRPANSIWLWGQGKKPMLSNFKEKTGLSGCVISAVDLIKGIGICADMQVIEVEGATGTVTTNFEGKAKAAVQALKDGKDFVYIHMEAPDEAGHRHEVENKVKAIELIDEKVVGYILKEFENEEISVLVMPDHPTPLITKTHSREPVPYIIWTNKQRADIKASGLTYTEKNAASTGIYVAQGQELMNKFLNK
ncbi:MAG: cofactor-independent phosphoglycerate mutase [Ruminococcaceae bacterium]|nr:cofactor-independent phosphoglycerate mutase [Oscillospiraceae bacterium]